MLKEIFENLLTKYTNDIRLKDELWTEVEKHYSNEKRHYHTLAHLDDLFNQLLKVKSNIKDWDTILFTLFYHDVVYDVTKPDNEEQSAKLAEMRMEQIFAPQKIITNCKKQILGTKNQQNSADMDTNYFLDADLSVLGQDLESYMDYCQNIRKEYVIYPNSIYNPERKKVLKHFLEMPRIYKTDHFYYKLEDQAKQNLKFELGQL